MTKLEAIEQMKLGKRLTHRYFTNDEWVKSDQDGSTIILEDGVCCSPNDFWQWRTDEAWNSDWEIYKK